MREFSFLGGWILFLVSKNVFSRGMKLCFSTLASFGLSLVYAVNVFASSNAFIDDFSLIEPSVSEVISHNKTVVYETDFNIPLQLSDAESYAKQHGLALAITSFEQKRGGGGSGCGHSPVCIIVLPFVLFNAMSSYTIDVATFSKDDLFLFSTEYDQRSGLLLDVTFDESLNASVSIDSSQLINRVFVQSASRDDNANIVEALYTALPTLPDDSPFHLFVSEVVHFAQWQNPDWESEQLERANVALKNGKNYSENQTTALVSLVCQVVASKSGESPSAVLSYTSAIESTENSQSVLDCVKDDEAYTVEQQAEIDRLANRQLSAFCHDADSFEVTDWHENIERFYRDYSPMMKSAAMRCSAPPFNIYQRWYEDQKVSQVDYEYLAKNHAKKSRTLRDSMTVADPNVLAARLNLASESRYAAADILSEIEKHQPAISEQTARQLSHLYWLDLYSISSFPFLPDTDRDIEKQARILRILSSTSAEMKRHISIEFSAHLDDEALFDSYAKAAFRVLFSNEIPDELMRLLVEKTPSVEDVSSVQSQYQVSTNVDDNGEPEHSDLIWLALYLNPTLGHSVEDSYPAALAEHNANKSDWLDGGRSLLNQVEGLF
ncbi:hypothetical protein [Enterovibrio baiacu]|nr:hypothetical protein [Enterovibrio baiacu]